MATTEDLLAQILAALKDGRAETTRLQSDLSQIETPELLENLEKQNKKLENQAKLLEESNQKMKEQEETSKRSIKIRNEELLLDQLRFNNLERSMQKQREIIVALEEREDLEGENQEKLEKAKDALKEIINLREESNEKIKEESKILKAANNFQENTKDLLKEMTGFKFSYESTKLSEFMKGFSVLSKEGGGVGIALNKIGKSIKETFSLPNILTAMYLNTKKVIGSTDELRAGFERVTGTTGEYTESVMTLRREYSAYGVGLKDSFEAMEGLMTQVAGFRDLNREIQGELAGHALVMKKLGVEYKTTSEFMQLSNKALNMNYEETQQVQGQFVKLADQLKMNSDELISSYNKSLSSLAVYGKEAPKVFANVAKFADKAGVSVETLLNMTQQFDTFEGAADQVGKLNAMLGGSYLSTIDMLNASEDERIRKIKQSMDAAGLQFDQMGKHQKRYITQTLGLQSVAEASAILSGSMADLDARLSEQNMTQEEAEKRAQRYTTIQQKLNILFENFAIALEPIIDILHALVDVVGAVLLPVLKFLDFTIGNLLRALVEVGKWIASSETLMYALGIVAGFLAVTFFTVSTAVFGASASFGMLGKAVMGLFSGFKKILLFLPKLVLGLFGLGKAAPAAGAGAAAASPGMIAFGLGMLLVGAGVALVVAALALLVYAFTDLIETASKAPGVMWEIAKSVGLVSVAAIGLGVAGKWAMLGLMALAVGFGALALALFLVSNDDLVAIGNVFGNLSKTMSNFEVSVFRSIISGLKEMADIIDDMDEDKVMSVGMTFRSMGGFIDKAGEQSAVGNIQNVIAGLDLSLPNATTNRAGAAPSAIRNVAGSSVAQAKMPPIIIKINEREIFKVVDKYMDQKANTAVA
jgi:hypothetical protein